MIFDCEILWRSFHCFLTYSLSEMIIQSISLIDYFIEVLPSYTPGIYAEGYIVFVFPFVCSSVRMLARS